MNWRLVRFGIVLSWRVIGLPVAIILASLGAWSDAAVSLLGFIIATAPQEDRNGE